MKPIMFILARIFGKRVSSVMGTRIVSYHWRECYWVWKVEKKATYFCRNCDRIISRKEYEARDGVCRRCWGQIDG